MRFASQLVALQVNTSVITTSSKSTVQIFKSRAVRREVIVWSVKLCNETDVFELPERKLLNLMSQELGIIPMEDNYVNPYRIKLKKSPEAKPKAKKKQREPREKKPRLSGRRLDL
jgi:hypothetical protein